MRAGDTNAVLRVKAAPDAPALVRTEILGPAGASFELRPAGEREFDAVFAPGDQPRGQHHWTVNLYPEGAETPALGLHLGKQVGEHWKCVPARLRAPVNGRDFVADLLVKPADGKDLPADAAKTRAVTKTRRELAAKTSAQRTGDSVAALIDEAANSIQDHGDRATALKGWIAGARSV